MIDTLKNTSAGIGAAWLPHLDLVPDIASVAVAIVTFIYLSLKIKKELGK